MKKKEKESPHFTTLRAGELPESVKKKEIVVPEHFTTLSIIYF